MKKSKLYYLCLFKRRRKYCFAQGIHSWVVWVVSFKPLAPHAVGSNPLRDFLFFHTRKLSN
jgi:hypothetical protein